MEGMNDILMFFDRKELEFIKNEVIEAVTDYDDNVCGDKEWRILLAAKMIEACKNSDEKNFETKPKETNEKETF